MDPRNANPEICEAIRAVLHECRDRPLMETSLLTYVRPKVSAPVILADVKSHLAFLEGRGEVAQIGSHDNPSASVSWTLTKKGRLVVAQS